MNDQLQKFAELATTDEAFQGKLKAALEAYDGEKTEEAIFRNVLVPVAAEYDITATYEEYKEGMEELRKGAGDKDLSLDELDHVAGGGKNWGFGITGCVGFGVGGGGSEEGGECVVVGVGWGATACAVSGYTAS